MTTEWCFLCMTESAASCIKPLSHWMRKTRFASGVKAPLLRCVRSFPSLLDRWAVGSLQYHSSSAAIHASPGTPWLLAWHTCTPPTRVCVSYTVIVPAPLCVYVCVFVRVNVFLCVCLYVWCSLWGFTCTDPASDQMLIVNKFVQTEICLNEQTNKKMLLIFEYQKLCFYIDMIVIYISARCDCAVT